MMYDLPKSLTVCGSEYEIRSDYRAVLDICAALSDNELDDQEKALAALDIMYPGFSDMPPEHYQEAVSFLFGTTIEASAEAAEALNKESEALDNVGGSAKKAEKALASFDEINRLSSGAGGGAGSNAIAPDFSALKKGLTGTLAFTMEGILFDWEDLTAEDILAKVVTGLTALAGGIIGFTVGGPGGAAIGLLIGAGIGLKLSNLIFDGDGKLNPEEILKTLALALGTLAGGIMGFVTGGGIGGAALGITLGAGVALALCGLVFNSDGVLSEEEILSSAIVALGALVGGIIGFSLGGGIGGAKIGAVIGAGITLSIVSLFFDGDGQLDPEEIKASLAVALGAIVGGIIGFVVLPGTGAAIGAIVGAGITAKIVDIAFEGGGGLSVDKIIGGLVEFLVAFAGGVIGFAAGGPLGAVIGATVGVGLSLLIDNAFFKSSGSGRKVGYDEGVQLGENVLQGTNDSLGINSPSTQYEETGGYMMQGMANGITANSALAVEAFRGTLATLQAEFNTWNGSFLDGVAAFGVAFSSDWATLWGAANIQFVHSWNNILDNFQNGINNAVSALNKLVAAANAYYYIAIG